MSCGQGRTSKSLVCNLTSWCGRYCFWILFNPLYNGQMVYIKFDDPLRSRWNSIIEDFKKKSKQNYDDNLQGRSGFEPW